MALRVLLVDDEESILEGLQVLIDWEKEGCVIVGTASTGMQAYEFLRETEVDLVIVDIRMPEMTGIELIRRVFEEKISSASFVIMSGYSDFKYAQTAIRYHCLEYMLKPVQKSELLELLRRVNHKKDEDQLEQERQVQLVRTCLAQYLAAVFRGKAIEEQIRFIESHLWLSERNHFVHITMDGIGLLEELTDEEIAQKKEQMFVNLEGFLGEDIDHCIPDVPGYEEDYEIGFVFCDEMLHRKGRYPDDNSYLLALKKAAERGLDVPVVLFVGKCAPDVKSLAYSYSSARTLRSFKGFQQQKEVYFYEEDIQVSRKSMRIMICKEEADRLLESVRVNDATAIRQNVDRFFSEMEDNGMSSRMISINIDYLLFQLIHLAFEIDESIEQEAVMQYISEISSDKGTIRGSRGHLRKFSCAYAEYLAQIRKNSAKGILADIGREVQEHYAENLTLRGLGQKYYINSSYLGQIFRNKYGQSFKDYLNSYRIKIAAKRLLETDERVLEIAEKVGYQDVDYFVKKFIEAEGCTPTKYRKKHGNR